MSNRQRTGENVEFVPVKKAKSKAAKAIPKALSLDQAGDEAATADQAQRPAAEQAAIDRTVKRRGEKAKLPVIEKHPKAGFNFGHEDGDSSAAIAVLQDTFATGDTALTGALIDQLARLSLVNEQHEPHRLRCLLSYVRAIGPENEIEALLAVQMAAVHDLTMKAADALRTSGHNIEAYAAASRNANKLARTFTMQLETLKRLRTKEQSIRVHHHTHDGGGGGEENRGLTS